MIPSELGVNTTPWSRKIVSYARTLEKAWEDKLRLVDEIEQEYRRWRDREPLVLQTQAALQQLAENLPAIWHSETTQPEDRKRILRFIVQARSGRHQDSLADRRYQRTSNPTPSSILRSRLWRTRACA
ncbi:hypothetical protein GGE07_006544 [Sinorhizobium terangae]|uniref:Uncharacterized protein n=1 Tax=Sinorhizobium terangae TaxID=110322 RepID=A0A6N7LF82_SINTE|nr:hypothetical protein [Sinorhizobium terangae]MBB4189838.1 hypothetical protein [Sinorhizobium terangae]MQX16523.1 hypothetical protein [Sinorhizobium terangae]